MEGRAGACGFGFWKLTVKGKQILSSLDKVDDFKKEMGKKTEQLG